MGEEGREDKDGLSLVVIAVEDSKVDVGEKEGCLSMLAKEMEIWFGKTVFEEER